ncbi:MAG: hypothetical protein Q9220_006580 [cf. Caloplaca sp. 1 TL-2023]
MLPDHRELTFIFPNTHNKVYRVIAESDPRWEDETTLAHALANDIRRQYFHKAIADEDTLRLVNVITNRADVVWWHPIMRQNRRKRAEHEAEKINSAFGTISLIDDATKLRLAELINNDMIHLLYFESLVCPAEWGYCPSVQDIRERRQLKEDQALLEAGIECPRDTIAKVNGTAADDVALQNLPALLEGDPGDPDTDTDADAGSKVVEVGSQASAESTLLSPASKIKRVDFTKNVESTEKHFDLSQYSEDLERMPPKEVLHTDTTDGNQRTKSEQFDRLQALEPMDSSDIGTSSAVDIAQTTEDSLLTTAKSPSISPATTIQEKLGSMTKEPVLDQIIRDSLILSSVESQQSTTAENSQSANETYLNDLRAPNLADTTNTSITGDAAVAHVLEDPASVATETLNHVPATPASSAASFTPQLLPAIEAPQREVDNLPVADAGILPKSEAQTQVQNWESHSLSRSLQTFTPIKIEMDVRTLLRAQDKSSNSPECQIRYSSSRSDKSFVNERQPRNKVAVFETSAAPASSSANSWQRIKWAYRTFTVVDDELLQQGLWLFDRPSSCQSTGFDVQNNAQENLSAQTIVIAGSLDRPMPECTFDSHVLTVNPHHPPFSNDQRSIHSFAGLVPDFLFSSKLAEYQAVEIAGRHVWRHDRDLLPCRGPQCSRVLSDMISSTLICLTCGPKSQTRFCSPECRYRSISTHAGECGNPSLLIPSIIDHATTPGRFSQSPPAIRDCNGFSTIENYRQRTMAQSSGGRYTLFDPTTHEPLPLFWDPRRTTSSLGHEFPYLGYAAEMESRVERCLNIALYDRSATVVVEHLFRLLQLCLQIKRAWSPALVKILATQFQSEFGYHVLRSSTRTVSGVPYCECEWAGDQVLPQQHHLGCQSRDRGQGVVFRGGRGVREVVEGMEERRWILRAWRRRHPWSSSWMGRVMGAGFAGCRVARDWTPRLGKGWEGLAGEDDDMDVN